MRHRILKLKKRDTEEEISPFFGIVLICIKGGQALRGYASRIRQRYSERSRLPRHKQPANPLGNIQLRANVTLQFFNITLAPKLQLPDYNLDS